ncbi:unnamed protein product [Blepharisma stoltei]|uniref:FYVE-type domain-containing protein n=1 Tax=Blepharisma stoltei TaxID=1481888 RepID=A0AAU9K9Q1_9CILI|nr:unnamed protein product [Blepharisma stoltei]
MKHQIIIKLITYMTFKASFGESPHENIFKVSVQTDSTSCDTYNNTYLPEFSQHRSSNSLSKDLSDSQLNNSQIRPGSDTLNIKNKKCIICNKGIGLRKSNYTCKVCHNYACSDHSFKKLLNSSSSKPQRICQNCDSKETEEAVKLHTKSFTDEAVRMDNELQNAKNYYIDINKDRKEKKLLIKKLEIEREGLERIHIQKKTRLHEQLEKEVQEGLKLKESVESLEKDRIDRENDYLGLKEKCEEKQQYIRAMQEKLEILNKRKELVLIQTKTIDKKIEKDEEMRKKLEKLCKKCYSRTRSFRNI